MHLLLADVQKQTRSLPATFLSVALHAVVIIAVVLSGQQVVRTVSALIEQTVQYLYPVDRKLGFEQPGQAGAVGNAPRHAPGTGTALLAGGSVGSGQYASTPSRGTTFPLPVDGTSAEPGVGDNAFSLVDVDTIAERDPSSVAPDYPATLVARKVEGGAVLRFVVDSTGLIDMTTVHVISATHSLFAKAVIEAMPRMKFRPARIGPRAVRLLVEQTYSFKIQRPKTSTT